MLSTIQYLNGHAATSTVQFGRMEIQPQASRTEDHAAVIDIIAHDPKTDAAVLVMNEEHDWDGSDVQLHQLQERFNTYASFLLDGEFAEAHPELAKKRARIEVRCTCMPDPRAIELLGQIHDQLAFQDIRVEVVVKEKQSCRGDCGCH
jgi:hypothetical protein